MLNEMLRSVGFGLCHQLPERSFFGGGIQVPVCARDTGIYLGFVASLALVWLLHRERRPSHFPSAAGWAVIGLFVGSMVLDGVTSYSGLRETSNLLRLITGTAAGFGIAAAVMPLLNGELWATRNEERVLSPGWKLAVWAGAMPLVVAAVWYLAPFLGLGYPVLVTVAILVTFTTVNMIFAAILPRFDRAARRARDLVGPALVGLALTVFEIAMAGALRVGLNVLVERLR